MKTMECLCRTCLKSSPNLLDLFSDDLPHQIEVISSIQILTDERLPTKICEDCVKNVHFLYNFRQTIVESDATLKERLVSENESNSKLEETKDNHIAIDEMKLEPLETNESDASEPASDTTKKKRLQRGYSCKKCDFTTTSYKLRKTHHLVHKNIIKVVCNICGASIRSDNLGKHISNIHADLPVSCNICEKVFKSKGSLRGHMISHEKISLQCTDCGKVYNSKKGYQKHMKRHTDGEGARIAECSICEKRFYTRTALKAHCRTHTGERPYTCRYCTKGFTSSSALKTHTRQHTNEKPFACDDCDAAFHQRVSLKTHIKSKHPDKIVPIEQKRD